MSGRTVVNGRESRPQRPARSPTRLAGIEAEISSLSALTLDQIRQTWRERLGGEPLALRTRDIVMRMLAWRLQADALGGFDTKTERRLNEIARGFERNPAFKPKAARTLLPGIVLTREWKGVLQRVTVTQDGFNHLGREYRSLSDVARAITGTRWSGPRFFGLERGETGSTP